MAKECVFCGTEIGFGGAKKIYLSSFCEICCQSCYEKYSSLPQLEIAKRLVATHRAKNEKAIEKYIPILEEASAEKEKADAKREQERELQEEQERRMCTPCPKCGDERRKYRTEFKLGEESLFFSDLARLMSGSLTVDMVRCTNCAFTEFYTPFAEELEDD